MLYLTLSRINPTSAFRRGFLTPGSLPIIELHGDSEALLQADRLCISDRPSVTRGR